LTRRANQRHDAIIAARAGERLRFQVRPTRSRGKYYHQCTSFAFQQPLRIAYGAARPISALNILP
jgi:hypothetical protein